jgi:coenzyme F420 hydrogenase subunit beta
MSAEELRDTVIAGGYCIGCGACAAADPQEFTMLMDELGLFRATLRFFK